MFKLVYPSLAGLSFHNRHKHTEKKSKWERQAHTHS